MPLPTDTKSCAHCNKSFHPTAAQLGRPARWRARRFCSNRCAGLAAPRTTRRDETERFWEKVDKSGECWTWRASRTAHGYGQFMNAESKLELAHRAAYRLTYAAPGVMRVCHRCDNPACVRPDHLFLGDAAANSADMVAKGRSTRGVKSASAKLTENDVRAIRADNRPQHEIAAEYGVHLCTISSIRTRRTWRHVN